MSSTQGTFFAPVQPDSQPVNSLTFNAAADLYAGSGDRSDAHKIDGTYVDFDDSGTPVTTEKGVLTMKAFTEEAYGLAVAPERVIRTQTVQRQATSALAVIYPNEEVFPAFAVSDVIIQKRDTKVTGTSIAPNLPTPEYGVTYAFIGLPRFFSEWLTSSVKEVTDMSINGQKFPVHDGRAWINAKIVLGKTQAVYYYNNEERDTTIKDLINANPKNIKGSALMALRLNRTSSSNGALPSSWSISATIMYFVFDGLTDEKGPVLEQKVRMKLKGADVSAEMAKTLSAMASTVQIKPRDKATPFGGAGIGGKFLAGRGPSTATSVVSSDGVNTSSV